MKKILIGVTCFLAAALIAANVFSVPAAHAQTILQVGGGGTGWGNPGGVLSGSILFGNGIGKLGTSTGLQFSSSARRLTATYASTTALSSDTICILTDCRTSWPSSGTGVGTVATSSQETKGQLPYFTSTNGYPATVSGVATTTLGGTANQISVSNSPVLIGANPAVLTLSAHVIFPGSFFSAEGTTTNATSTNFTVTNNLIATQLTSALVLTGSGGAFAEYAGTSCTNQFVRSLSALGAATCATVANTDLANSTISGISLGSNLADLTATNSTLTFSGTYNGSTARTIGLNLGNANAWTATQTISTLLGVGTTTPFFGLSLGSGNGSSTKAILVAEHQPATSTSQTIDWKNGNSQLIRIAAPAVAVTFTNVAEGAQLKLTVCNMASAGALTFSTQVLWAGGTTPTQTTTSNKCDVWSFIATMATSGIKIFGAQTANF